MHRHSEKVVKAFACVYYLAEPYTLRSVYAAVYESIQGFSLEKGSAIFSLGCSTRRC